MRIRLRSGLELERETISFITREYVHIYTYTCKSQILCYVFHYTKIINVFGMILYQCIDYEYSGKGGYRRRKGAVPVLQSSVLVSSCIFTLLLALSIDS